MWFQRRLSCRAREALRKCFLWEVSLLSGDDGGPCSCGDVRGRRASPGSDSQLGGPGRGGASRASAGVGQVSSPPSLVPACTQKRVYFTWRPKEVQGGWGDGGSWAQCRGRLLCPGWRSVATSPAAGVPGAAAGAEAAACTALSAGGPCLPRTAWRALRSGGPGN